MPDQETLREIKRVLELTSRIDERVKMIAESNEKITERFDRFAEQHNTLAERVAKLESKNGDKLDEKLEDMRNRQLELMGRITAMESSSPYALKVVNSAMEALNKLGDRVSSMENQNTVHHTKLGVWGGWAVFLGEWVFKVALIIIAAAILAKLGLGAVNVPAP